MKIVYSPNDGVWLATGYGFDKPIVAEGVTEEDAREGFEALKGAQYAIAQTITSLSLWRKQ